MLDKAFSEIEEEKSEEAAKAEEKSAEPIIDSAEEITDKPVENDEKKASPLEFHNDYSSPERKPGGKKKKSKKKKKNIQIPQSCWILHIRQINCLMKIKMLS